VPKTLATAGELARTEAAGREIGSRLAMESPAKEEAGGELAMEIESSVTAEDWRRALSRVVPSVVVLRTTAPRAFDTEVAGASYATGFVVDKSRGIILTNRHVVKPGRNASSNHHRFSHMPLVNDLCCCCCRDARDDRACGRGGHVHEQGRDPCVPPVQRSCECIFIPLDSILCLFYFPLPVQMP